MSERKITPRKTIPLISRRIQVGSGLDAAARLRRHRDDRTVGGLRNEVLLPEADVRDHEVPLADGRLQEEVSLRP